MAQFIQKFESMEDYNASEHQYPNISLVEGEGLIWTAENPKETILFNDSEIKWTLDANQYDTMKSGALNIDLNAAVTFYNAVVNGTVSTSNAWFELDGTRYDAEVTLKGGGSLIFNVILKAITNTKSAVPQVYYHFTIIDGRDAVEGLIIEETGDKIAHWGLNYTIEEASQDESE